MASTVTRTGLLVLFLSSNRSSRSCWSHLPKRRSYFTLLLQQIGHKTLEGFRLNSRIKPKLLTRYSKTQQSFRPSHPPDFKKVPAVLQGTELTVPRTRSWAPDFPHLLTFAHFLSCLESSSLHLCLKVPSFKRHFAKSYYTPRSSSSAACITSENSTAGITSSYK